MAWERCSPESCVAIEVKAERHEEKGGGREQSLSQSQSEAGAGPHRPRHLVHALSPPLLHPPPPPPLLRLLLLQSCTCNSLTLPIPNFSPCSPTQLGIRHGQAVDSGQWLNHWLKKNPKLLHHSRVGKKKLAGLVGCRQKFLVGSDFGKFLWVGFHLFWLSSVGSNHSTSDRWSQSSCPFFPPPLFFLHVLKF